MPVSMSLQAWMMTVSGNKYIILGWQKLNTILNRPSVVGDALQASVSLINSLSNLVILCKKYLKNTFTSEPQEVGSWHFEKKFTFPHLSCVTFHVSHIACHLIFVIYIYIFKYMFDKVVKLVSSVKKMTVCGAISE